MASKTVKSPAGETIEIVPDDEWMALTDTNTHSLRQWSAQKGMKPKVLRALWEHGEFTNDSGRVAWDIYQWLMERFPQRELAGQNFVLALFRNPVNNPAVEIKTKGKRTFRMKLVSLPETWHRKLLQDIEPAQEAPEAPETAQEAIAAAGYVDATDAIMELVKPEPEPEFEALPMDLHVAQQVAMSMLTTVVEIISSGRQDPQAYQKLQADLADSQGLLAARLAENTRLRNQLGEAGDAISALRQERDGLRARLRQTEYNLSQALKGEAAQAVNTEIHRQVEKIMRTAPVAKGD